MNILDQIAEHITKLESIHNTTIRFVFFDDFSGSFSQYDFDDGLVEVEGFENLDELKALLDMP